ncbi:paraneoplastic antigen Ma1 homolog [Ascaphus truei]|uniref:paraneoplastic antigen Ma1 homolog n=1 Tax=Ascaphus truei TaxID=8439 RepID=UPI003F5A8526
MALPTRHEIHDWDRQVRTPTRRAVALARVPIALPLETLQTALRQLLSFAKVRLVDVLVDRDSKWNTLLVDCRRILVTLDPAVPQSLALPDVPPGGSLLVYPLRDPLVRPLDEEDPTLPFAYYAASDVGSCQSASSYLGSSASAEAGGSSNMLQKLNDKIDMLSGPHSLRPLVEALTLATHAQNYRKLKAFSGTLPVPTGEDGVETWKEHTRGVMEVWSCTDVVKRQRLMECLRPPAATLIAIYREQYPDLTSRLMIEFLAEAYSATEDDGALWAKYCAINQREGEELSAYIHRVQISLGLLLHYKHVLPSQMDEYLRKQYLRGSSPTHPIASMIRDRLTRGPTPSFIQLLQQMKKHETHLMLHSHQKPKTSGSTKTKGSNEKKRNPRTNLAQRTCLTRVGRHLRLIAV